MTKKQEKSKEANTAATPKGDVLYAEGRIEIAFEAGRKAANYAMSGDYGVHLRDSALKCALEVNAIVSSHDDAENLPKGSAPDTASSDEERGQKMLEVIDECESKLPKGATGIDPASLDPAILMLLVQLGGMAINLFRSWFGK